MDKTLIEKYKAEMLNMQRRSKSLPTITTTNVQRNPNDESSGNLLVIVTTLRSLYPVPNAEVTVFKGDYNDMQIIATSTTDQSGRSDNFSLPAPQKSLSLDSANTQKPYETYNLLVKAEGYIDNVHLNIPIFSGVTSLQRSNMLLLETAGVDKGPQFFDEAQQFQL